jgi:hypothetical protein
MWHALSPKGESCSLPCAFSRAAEDMVAIAGNEEQRLTDELLKAES